MKRYLVAGSLALLASWTLAHAQATPAAADELMLSWRSNGFAPSGYAGRVAASGGGQVLVTAEAISGGRPASLSGYEVRWYVNDELYESGLGIQGITYYVPESHQDSFDVRVEIVGAPFAVSMANLTVPLTDPQAVISRDERGIREGDNVFHAVPYSFNVTNASDLVYQWTVNGQAPESTENPSELTVSYASDPADPLSLNLSVTHPQRAAEEASYSIRIDPAR